MLGYTETQLHGNTDTRIRRYTDTRTHRNMVARVTCGVMGSDEKGNSTIRTGAAMISLPEKKMQLQSTNLFKFGTIA